KAFITVQKSQRLSCMLSVWQATILPMNVAYQSHGRVDARSGLMGYSLMFKYAHTLQNKYQIVSRHSA
ncbi:hypothetical protein, partial [Klebsiella variicola]|uniref:hypothetical protein n=1 Tax=Klebsiella variicola TaxID=244366 RepID=UPI001C9A3070